jgi:hypothetical protein
MTITAVPIEYSNKISHCDYDLLGCKAVWLADRYHISDEPATSIFRVEESAKLQAMFLDLVTGLSMMRSMGSGRVVDAYELWVGDLCLTNPYKPYNPYLSWWTSPDPLHILLRMARSKNMDSMLSHSRRPNHDNTLRTFNLTESHSSKFL